MESTGDYFSKSVLTANTSLRIHNLLHVSVVQNRCWDAKVWASPFKSVSHCYFHIYVNTCKLHLGPQPMRIIVRSATVSANLLTVWEKAWPITLRDNARKKVRQGTRPLRLVQIQEMLQGWWKPSYHKSFVTRLKVSIVDLKHRAEHCRWTQRTVNPSVSVNHQYLQLYCQPM